MGDPRSWDRRLGRRLRGAIDGLPGGSRAGRLAGDALGPGFEALVAAMLARPGLRRAGVEALAGATCASAVARRLRDAIGRTRPGDRADGGFPSRHAASALAIARAAGRRHPALRPWLVAAVAAGLAGRVAAGHHDPGDIAAGGALGWTVDWLVERIVGEAA